jgi:hypothetical protein
MAFYEKRAGESMAKGDLDAALADYTKAIDMNGSAGFCPHGTRRRLHGKEILHSCDRRLHQGHRGSTRRTPSPMHIEQRRTRNKATPRWLSKITRRPLS